MSNNEERGFMKVLKWAGLIALIAVPMYIVLKKKRASSDRSVDDESNIFAADLEE